MKTRLGEALVDLHERAVHRPRVERVARALADHAGHARSLLDVGCGTGEVARRVADLTGASEVRGVDVKIRPGVVIDAQSYDGLRLPFGDGAFELVLLSDMLHHCEDPEPVLREALRVAGRAVLVKDHFAFGPLSRLALLAMDHVGNAGPGVRVEGRYLDFAGWVDLCGRAGGRVARLTWPLRIHSPPFSLVTSPSWQFVATVERTERTERQERAAGSPR